MITTKLTTMPYANAKIVTTDNGDKHLISYTTRVLTLTADGWLTVYGLYSRTTIRHIGAFMKENIIWPNGTRGSYYDAKALYLDNISMNILTGEVK